MNSLPYVHEILPSFGRLDDKIEWMTKRERNKTIRENLCYPWCKKKEFHKEKKSLWNSVLLCSE